MSWGIVQSRDPKLHSSIKGLAETLDMTGRTTVEIRVFHRDYEYLKKLGLTHYNQHPIDDAGFER